MSVMDRLTTLEKRQTTGEPIPPVLKLRDGQWTLNHTQISEDDAMRLIDHPDRAGSTFLKIITTPGYELQPRSDHVIRITL